MNSLLIKGCIIGVISTVILFSESCTPKEITLSEELACPVTAVNGSDNTIKGSWKMIWRRTMAYGKVDLSCRNVSYHFEGGGKLRIESDTSFVSERTTTYDLSGNGLIGKRSKIKIGSVTYTCDISKYQLKLDGGAERDGEVRYFARIK